MFRNLDTHDYIACISCPSKNGNEIAPQGELAVDCVRTSIPLFVLLWRLSASPDAKSDNKSHSALGCIENHHASSQYNFAQAGGFRALNSISFHSHPITHTCVWLRFVFLLYIYLFWVCNCNTRTWIIAFCFCVSFCCFSRVCVRMLWFFFFRRHNRFSFYRRCRSSGPVLLFFSTIGSGTFFFGLQ